MTKEYTQNLENILGKTEFLERVYFRSSPVNAECMINDIAGGIQKLSTHVFDETDLGSLQLLFCRYINELWITEIPPEKDFKTEDIVFCLLQNEDVIEPLRRENIKNPEHVSLQLRNLLAASKYVFGADFRSFRDVGFTPTLAQDIHRKVAEDIIEGGGQYRTKFVQAAQSTVRYADPSVIEPRMDSLFEFVNLKTANYIRLDLKERTKKMFLLAAVFFADFLLIHPFSNGNGRTARLLLNFLLKDITVVPFSLYVGPTLTDKPRDIYIRALEERNDGTAPSLLASVILLSAYQAYSNLQYIIFS